MGDDGNGGLAGINNILPKPGKKFINTSNQHVDSKTFQTYAESQDKLCHAYRAHQSDLIEGVRDEIKNAIYLTGAILGLIVTVSTIALLVWGQIGGV